LRIVEQMPPHKDMDFFKIEAAKNYDSVDYASFEYEYNRIQIIKKHAKKYFRTSTLNERLFLNHIIILYNMFGRFATNMLFKTLPMDHWSMLIPVLIFLDRMPDTIPYTNIKVIDYPLDKAIQERISKI